MRSRSSSSGSLISGQSAPLSTPGGAEPAPLLRSDRRGGDQAADPPPHAATPGTLLPIGQPLAFGVGTDHVPVPDRDSLDAFGAQRIDRGQHLVGHQPPPAGIGGAVGGEAFAVVLDPRNALHVGGDQEVHRPSLVDAPRPYDVAMAEEGEAAGADG